MSNERKIIITRPGNFDECNSCELLNEELVEAIQTVTHRRTKLPLEVEEIHVECREREKEMVYMKVRVGGTITNPNDSQATGYDTKEIGVGCPHYHPSKNN